MNETLQFRVEKRRHPRTMVQMNLRGIRLDPEGGDVLNDLHMTNISRSGMGVVCDRPFYPGQRVVLCLPLSNVSGRRNLYATVRRCHVDSETERYRVGLEFDRSSEHAYYGDVSARTMAA